jgi:hypothetical protein
LSFAASPFPSMLKRIKDDPLESVMFGLLAVLRDVRLGLRRCVTLSTKSAPMTPGPIDFRGGLPTTALVERAEFALSPCPHWEWCTRRSHRLHPAET